MNEPEPILPEPDAPVQDPANPVEEPPTLDDVESYQVAGWADSADGSRWK